MATVSITKLNRQMSLFSGNVEKLMKADGISVEQMAAWLGIKPRTFRDKLNDPRRFSLDEVVIIMNKLKFDAHSCKETFCFS